MTHSLARRQSRTARRLQVQQRCRPHSSHIRLHHQCLFLSRPYTFPRSCPLSVHLPLPCRSLLPPPLVHRRHVLSDRLRVQYVELLSLVSLGRLLPLLPTLLTLLVTLLLAVLVGLPLLVESVGSVLLLGSGVLCGGSLSELLGVLLCATVSELLRLVAVPLAVLGLSPLVLLSGLLVLAPLLLGLLLSQLPPLVPLQPSLVLRPSQELWRRRLLERHTTDPEMVRTRIHSLILRLLGSTVPAALASLVVVPAEVGSVRLVLAKESEDGVTEGLLTVVVGCEEVFVVFQS